MSAPVKLDSATIEQIAERVAELLRDETPTPDGLIDAAEVARRLNCSRDHVYRRAHELGAIRLGNGDKARLRFDPATVAEALNVPPPPGAPAARRRPSTHTRTRAVALLPVRGEGA